MRSKALLAIFMIFIFCLVLFGCMEKAREEAEADKKPVIVKEMVKETISEEEIYNTKLLPINEIDLSFELPGVIDKLYKNDGDLVQKGELIASLDLEQQRLRLEKHYEQKQETLLGIEKLKIRKEELIEDYERKKVFYKEGGISKVALESAQSQLDLLEKDLEMMESRYRALLLMEQELVLGVEKSSLYASSNGVILRRHVQEGHLVGAGQPVYSIGQVEQLKLIVNVPVAELDNWSKGRQVAVHYNGERLSATVEKVLPVTTGATGKVPVEFILDNTDRGWLAGELVRVIDHKEAREGFFVPIEAVMKNRNPYVFVVIDDMVTEREISLGLPISSQVEIFGLNEGDMVVVGGMERLQSGDLVRIIE